MEREATFTEADLQNLYYFPHYVIVRRAVKSKGNNKED